MKLCGFHDLPKYDGGEGDGDNQSCWSPDPGCPVHSLICLVRYSVCVLRRINHKLSYLSFFDLGFVG